MRKCKNAKHLKITENRQSKERCVGLRYYEVIVSHFQFARLPWKSHKWSMRSRRRARYSSESLIFALLEQYSSKLSNEASDGSGDGSSSGMYSMRRSTRILCNMMHARITSLRTLRCQRRAGCLSINHTFVIIPKARSTSFLADS